MVQQNDKHRDEIPSMFNDWKYRFPSASVRERIVGDRETAEKFRGDANLLLYQVKNAMVPNQLGQLQGTRTYNDGTVITASSVFGQDEITITTGIVGGNPSCIIQLYDLPKEIPPMMWYNPNNPAHELFVKTDGQWIITKPNGDIEIEGTDYIKTYYSASKFGCPSCNPADFTIGKGDMFGKNPAPSYDGSHRPFKYKSETSGGSLIYDYEGAMVPHFMGYGPPPNPPIPEDPLNHVIYSLYGSAGADILLFDFDDGGTYFLWKAYTEWGISLIPDWVTFSRTGLGYLLMKGFIKNKGVILCQSESSIIKVDCCVKNIFDRKVIMWWDSIEGGIAGGPTCVDQPFMFYTWGKICEVPALVRNVNILLCGGPGGNSKPIYTIPDIQGGCLPFTWTTDNPKFEIVPSQPFGEIGYLVYHDCADGMLCTEHVTVHVEDRCETEDSAHFLSCCEQAVFDGNDVPFIGYDLLSMGFEQQQILSAGWGCGPYTWTASHGTIEFSGAGGTALYTSPADNHDCGSNPLITVTDCCGKSGTLQLAVTNNSPGNAFVLCEQIVCVDQCTEGDPTAWRGYMHVIWYDCGGNVFGEACYQSTGVGIWPCECPGAGWQGCADKPWCANCPGGACGYNDIRTVEMKEAGCCPINPLTGLPF